MDPKLQQISDAQKQSWNEFSPGWRKWDDILMEANRPAGEAIIISLRLNPDDIVLDVASGTGEPGLSIAALVPTGKVVITDIANKMLDIALDHAAKRGLTNIETVACDVSAMPFEDDTFNAISCRFGFMFFPDMSLALMEMFRILKPGGRLSIAVWNGPEQNQWVSACSRVIKRHIDIQETPPGAPGMFRCAQPGLMAGLFQKAGFENVVESEVVSRVNAGTAEAFWTMTREVAAPFASALKTATDAQVEIIKSELFDWIFDNYTEGHVNIPSSAQVISGSKPVI